MIVKAGEVLFIPHGTPHAVKNVGTGKAVELATYIVEKGKPLSRTRASERRNTPTSHEFHTTQT